MWEIKERVIFKKVIVLLILVCTNINITTWGQTRNGIKWFREAEAGDSLAQYIVSCYHELGIEGFSKDEKESIKWLMKSANSGCSLAKQDIANCYLKGLRGFPKDNVEYTRWILKKNCQMRN